jgi:hypothetical protein
MIDYIFFSRQLLRTVGLLGPLDVEWIKNNKIVGFPHPHVPSDHLPLMVELELTYNNSASNQNNNYGRSGGQQLHSQHHLNSSNNNNNNNNGGNNNSMNGQLGIGQMIPINSGSNSFLRK